MGNSLPVQCVWLRQKPLILTSRKTGKISVQLYPGSRFWFVNDKVKPGLYLADRFIKISPELREKLRLNSKVLVEKSKPGVSAPFAKIRDIRNIVIPAERNLSRLLLLELRKLVAARQDGSEKLCKIDQKDSVLGVKTQVLLGKNPEDASEVSFKLSFPKGDVPSALSFSIYVPKEHPKPELVIRTALVKDGIAQLESVSRKIERQYSLSFTKHLVPSKVILSLGSYWGTFFTWSYQILDPDVQKRLVAGDTFFRSKKWASALVP